VKQPNEPGCVRRILLLGGMSEIGLAILAALALPAGTEVILAGRDQQRLAAAAKALPYCVRTVTHDATEVGGHQAFMDGICADADPLARWTWSYPRLASWCRRRSARPPPPRCAAGERRCGCRACWLGSPPPCAVCRGPCGAVFLVDPGAAPRPG
jgi:hypothetical protein